jgi:SHS family lactate transporter-like MFS transporter
LLFVTLSTLGDDAGWRVGFVILGCAEHRGVGLAGSDLAAGVAEVVMEYQPCGRRKAACRGVAAHQGAPSRTCSAAVSARGAIAFIVMATGIFIYSYSLGTFSSTFLLKTAQVPLGGTTLICSSAC